MAIFSKGYYESRLTDDSKKKNIFEGIWNSVNAIDIGDYSRQFTIADSTSNLTDLQALSSRLDSEIAVCDGIRTSHPKNQDAVQVAIDMKNDLIALKSKVKSSIDFISGKSLSSKIPGIRRVVAFKKGFDRATQPINDFGDRFAKGFKKFSHLADSAYNSAEDFAENGIGKGVKDISNGVDSLFGIHKKK